MVDGIGPARSVWMTSPMNDSRLTREPLNGRPARGLMQQARVTIATFRVCSQFHSSCGASVRSAAKSFKPYMAKASVPQNFHLLGKRPHALRRRRRIIASKSTSREARMMNGLGNDVETSRRNTRHCQQEILIVSIKQGATNLGE
jgi:hypothetical protein